MVKSIVIPHDSSQPPRLQELADIGAFQQAVNGWLDLVEVPGLGVTMYVNEAGQREHAPLNCRAMSLWWLYSADPTAHSVIVGDVVLTGWGDDAMSRDIPDSLVAHVFDQDGFQLQVCPYGDDTWHDTYAWFRSIFEAAPWCLLLIHTLRAGAKFRLRPLALDASVDDILDEDASSW